MTYFFIPIGLLIGALIALLFHHMPVSWLADYGEEDLTEAQRARDGLSVFPGMLLIMLVDGLIFFASAHLIGPVISLPVILYAAQPLLLIAISDFRARIIPDQLVLALIPAGLLLWVSDSIKNPARWLPGLPSRLLAALAAGVFLWVCGWLAAKWLHRDAMGMGDVKLLAVCAFLVDWPNLVFLLCLSFLLAAVVAVPLLIRRRIQPDRDPELAFGPYIVMATFLLLVASSFVQQWWQAYLTLLI